MTHQTCTKCLVEKPVEEFAMDRSRRKPKCRACTAEYDQQKKRAVQSHFNSDRAPYSLILENRPPVGTPCELCGTHMTHTPGPSCMTFDHDPETGTFRGWICSKCNTGLGALGDNVSGLATAILYLAQPTSPHGQPAH